jgi:oligoendopeptidase F
MSIAEQINVIIEQMPEKRQSLISELIKTMISPDDVLTDEDIADIEQARAEFASGEAIPASVINWD